MGLLIGFACTLCWLGTVHAVVAQAVGMTQQQQREPRPCVQRRPVRCKVVPHSVVVELNLRNVAVLANAKGNVVGESLGDVVFEEAGMVRCDAPRPC